MNHYLDNFVATSNAPQPSFSSYINFIAKKLNNVVSTTLNDSPSALNDSPSALATNKTPLNNGAVSISQDTVNFVHPRPDLKITHSEDGAGAWFDPTIDVDITRVADVADSWNCFKGTHFNNNLQNDHVMLTRKSPVVSTLAITQPALTTISDNLHVLSTVGTNAPISTDLNTRTYASPARNKTFAGSWGNSV